MIIIIAFLARIFAVVSAIIGLILCIKGKKEGKINPNFSYTKQYNMITIFFLIIGYLSEEFSIKEKMIMLFVVIGMFIVTSIQYKLRLDTRITFKH